MYSDYNKRAPTHRANDEFLRRMIGGELNGPELLRLHSEMLELPEERGGRRVDCRGNVLEPERSCPEKRARDGGDACDRESCPTEISAPALAMVYAPRQCWRKTFDPQTGLAHGSIFAELVLPFEGCPKYGRTEGKPCK